MFPRTRCHARTRFSRSHTSSIRCVVVAGLSGSATATTGSTPGSRAIGGSPLSLSSRASSRRVFCRSPVTRCQSYLPLPIVRAFDHRFRLGLSVAPPFGWSASLALPTSWPTMPSADSCAPIRSPCGFLSSFRNGTQVSPGKFNRLHRTPAGSTGLVLDGCGLRNSLPARPTRCASYPVSVRQVAALLHTSFRRHLAMTPLCFANPSPPSGWMRDFHPQAIEHAGHTTNPLPRESAARKVAPEVGLSSALDF